jgi:hypothetical protein
MATKQSGLLVIERILRDRQGIWQQIVDERDLGQLTTQMLASSAIALAAFGAVLGTFGGPLMTLTSAVKLPLLFLCTLAICLPTLYLFNLVFGSRLSVRQALALVMTAVTVISTLSLAFAPISLFFRITITDKDYEFFKLLNVGILTLSAFVGLRFLVAGMNALNATELARDRVLVSVPEQIEAQLPEPAAVGAAASGDGQLASKLPVEPAPSFGSFAPAPSGAQAGEKPASMTLLYVWILLFGFVGTQLAWTLRPFFGAPTEDFSLFRHIEGNFYGAILSAIGNLFT